MQKIEYSGFAPSFSCYTSNSIASTAVAKVIREAELARVHETGEDFEFSLVLNDDDDDDKREDSSSSSCSASEADESESVITKCKKSSSTGSRSKRWIFWCLLRRTNSEGKEAKKVDSLKLKLNSGGRWNAQSPVHEQFYVQRRAEREAGKRRSYLPYRKDLVGLFANVNGMGKMLPF